MWAPSCASRTAWERPCPRAPPVMNATLPSNRPIVRPFSLSGSADRMALGAHAVDDLGAALFDQRTLGDHLPAPPAGALAPDVVGDAHLVVVPVGRRRPLLVDRRQRSIGHLPVEQSLGVQVAHLVDHALRN